MRTRQPYTACRIYVDGFPELQEGDYLRTTGGSAYLVQALKASPTRPRRRYLTCLRWPVEEIPAGARVFEIRWYPRDKRRPTTLKDLA